MAFFTGRSEAEQVTVSDTELGVRLRDGRTITVPLRWFPTLDRATQAQRDNFTLIGNGEGIRWPELDEDVSIAGLLISSTAA